MKRAGEAVSAAAISVQHNQHRMTTDRGRRDRNAVVPGMHDAIAGGQRGRARDHGRQRSGGLKIAAEKLIAGCPGLRRGQRREDRHESRQAAAGVSADHGMSYGHAHAAKRAPALASNRW